MSKKYYRAKVGSKVRRISDSVTATVLISRQISMTVQIGGTEEKATVKKQDWVPLKKDGNPRSISRSAFKDYTAFCEAVGVNP